MRLINFKYEWLCSKIRICPISVNISLLSISSCTTGFHTHITVSMNSQTEFLEWVQKDKATQRSKTKEVHFSSKGSTCWE